MADEVRRGGNPEAKGPRVSIRRLPVTSRELFGRTMDLAWLDACWRDEVHVATIVAWGGVGKSSLVNAWLAGMRDQKWEAHGRRAERVFGWSFYSQGTDRLGSSDELFAVALREFGHEGPAPTSPWEKGERLARLVGEQRAILVLDGLEPLQWAPGVQEGRLKDQAVEALLKELAGQNEGMCLITSRVGLTDLDGVGGDKVRALALDHLSAEAGAALLRACKVKGSEEELREAAEEYKGHGLALTLLGSYLTDVAEGDVRRRNEIGALAQDERLGGHARRVMAAYEPWLGGVERAYLLMLGLFDRPAEAEEIAALRAEPAVSGLTEGLAGVDLRGRHKAVAKLRRMGLLAKADGQDKRLDAHPLVRQHFGEQLRKARPDAWREGHRRLYEHMRRKATEYPETVEEMAPLYAAVVHGCLAGKNREAYHEVYAMRINRGHEDFNVKRLGAFSGEVAVLSAFFSSPWEQLRPGLTDPEAAILLGNAGSALRAVGRLSEAGELMRRSLAWVIRLEMWRDAAAAAMNLSDILLSQGDLRGAVAQASEGVKLADQSGDPFQRMAGSTTLAAALHAIGRRDEAAALFAEAERMQKERQPEYPLLYLLQGFQYCDLLLDQGRGADVLARATKLIEWRVPDDSFLSIALEELSFGRAHYLAARSSPPSAADHHAKQAADHLQQAVGGLRRAGTRHHLPLGLLAGAALRTHTHAFAEARHDLAEALTLSTRCGFRLHEADAHLGFARLALAERDPAAAADHLARARAIIDATSYHRRDGELGELTAEAETMARSLVEAGRATGSREEDRKGARAQGSQGDRENSDSLRPSRPCGPLSSSSSGHPAHDSPPATPMTATATPVDLGIVIALPEELREMLDLAGGYTPRPDDDLDSYLFTHGNYRCAVTLVGHMGQSQATRVAERLIAAFDPENILSIGIAAGVHDDLRVGDVHVASQAVEYMQDGKASPSGEAGFVIVPGAPAYRADFMLHKAVVGLEFNHRQGYKGWREACGADLDAIVSDAPAREKLFGDKLVRRDVKLLADGHVATGPVVGAAPAFSAWLRSHDRNVKSLEMESAAVLLAAQTRREPKRALAIRGISDYGDERKQKLDEIGDGALRKYAMRNAVRLLFALLDAEVLPQRPR